RRCRNTLGGMLAVGRSNGGHRGDTYGLAPCQAAAGAGWLGHARRCVICPPLSPPPVRFQSTVTCRLATARITPNRCRSLGKTKRNHLADYRIAARTASSTLALACSYSPGTKAPAAALCPPPPKLLASLLQSTDTV